VSDAVGFLCLYVVYIAVVLGGRFVNQRYRKRQQKEEELLNESEAGGGEEDEGGSVESGEGTARNSGTIFRQEMPEK
jgi:hypothetical protein